MRHNETVNMDAFVGVFNVRRAHRVNVSDGDVGRGIGGVTGALVTGAGRRGENSVRDAMETGD